MGTHPVRNKGVAILEQMQAGRPALIQKDGGEMLIASSLTRQGISGRPCRVHSRNDQDSARKAKLSTYCANDQASRK